MKITEWHLDKRAKWSHIYILHILLLHILQEEIAVFYLMAYISCFQSHNETKLKYELIDIKKKKKLR